MKLIKFLLRIYKIFISPFILYECRFYPSCSDYMLIAMEKKGFLKGCLLSFKRILKCNFLFPGGYDPVK